MTGKLFSTLGRSYGGRFRLAVVLLVMFVTILAGKFWEGIYVENLRHDCGSLFQDRLLPAVTLFHLMDEIHTKRETLEEYLHHEPDDSKSSIDYRLGEHDAAINHLVHEIEKTYLVDRESRLLVELRAALKRYNELETQTLKRYRSGEPMNYNGEMREAFAVVRTELLGLTKVQEDVGQQLNRDSDLSASHVTSLLYFQLGVTFILGLMASGLAMSLGSIGSPSPPTKSRDDENLH